VVLVAIDPVQQLAKTRDSGRLSTVTQLGRSVQAFATSNEGEMPNNDAGGNCATNTGKWITDCLVASGDIGNAPTLPAYTAGGAACNTSGGGRRDIENNICLGVADVRAVVYAGAEADANISKCNSGELAYFVYAVHLGRGGLVCTGVAGTVPIDPVFK